MASLNIPRYTPEDAKRYYEEAYALENEDEAYDNSQHQLENEKRFVRANIDNICPESNPQHKELACMVSSVQKADDNVKREAFPISKLLGQGAFGLVVESGQLAIKVEPCCEPFHEIFVGYFINKLNSDNFTYLYGYFQCGHMIKKNNMYQICDKDGKYVYTVIDKITGKILANWLEEHTDMEEIYALYLCLLGALALANRELNFTHYDLHTGNVIVKDLGKPFIFYYQIGERVYEIVSRYMPVIIDLGFAHIKTANENVGVWGFEFYGVFADRAFPLFDFIRLVNSSLLYSKSGIFLRWFNQYSASPVDVMTNNNFKNVIPPFREYLDVTYDRIFEYVYADRLENIR